MSSEPAISAHHVSKIYQLGLSGRSRSFAAIARDQFRHPFRFHRRELFRALDDISFDIAPGEAVGIIGSNGAGKSTLLKILSRITPPSRGHIDMVGNVGSLLEIGTGFHPELTGIENVYLNGVILGMSKRQIGTRLEEILEFAELDSFLETPIKRYSTGMRVRLAFAVAAHLDPEVLIVDEVLSVGDQAFQAKCLEKMRSFAADDGRTVLYVSHQLATVEHLCPRAILLSQGRLAFDGPTREAVTHYLQMFPTGQRGSTPGVFDCTEADRSSGTYEQVVGKVVLRPEGGTPSDTVRIGDRMVVEVEVSGFDRFAEPLVYITFGSPNNPVLFRMTSRMQPLLTGSRRTSREVITIHIPSMPLTPGRYNMDVQLKDNRNKTIDFVSRAAEFTVVPADMLGTGYRFDAQGGYDEGAFVVPWEWEVRPLTPRQQFPADPVKRRSRSVKSKASSGQ